MPNTTHGVPYPAATDPVAQGAAAMQSIAQTLDAKAMAMAGGNGQDNNVTAALYPAFDAEIMDSDWNGITVGQPGIILPNAGVYLVVANCFFTGASGSGSVHAALEFWRGGASIDVIAKMSGGMNEALSLSGIMNANANDVVRLWLQAGATGAGHNVAWRMYAMRRY